MQCETFISVSINDLDWLFIEREYLPAAVSAEVLEHNNRSRETQLSSLRFLTADMKPNNAAVLCFHDNPQQYLPGAYVQFVRFSSSEIDGEITDQQEIRGSIFRQIRVVEEKFCAHNINGAIIGENKRNENSDYPFMAFSQAIRNALMHRNYESNAPVRVYWFADRIEIYNPGCAFGDVTMENFGKDSVTDYRNPLLAEALKSQGYVEKFGAGIGIIKKSMKDNNNPPPHFESHEQYSLIILHRRKS
ncbi:MAG: ATP-binding protein [Gammaproteobacteria bacterium WSBS_2016_MAG_OTU1]